MWQHDLALHPVHPTLHSSGTCKVSSSPRTSSPEEPTCLENRCVALVAQANPWPSALHHRLLFLLLYATDPLSLMIHEADLYAALFAMMGFHFPCPNYLLEASLLTELSPSLRGLLAGLTSVFQMAYEGKPIILPPVGNLESRCAPRR